MAAGFRVAVCHGQDRRDAIVARSSAELGPRSAAHRDYCPIAARRLRADDRPMPPQLILILGAVVYVVILCLVLWIIGETTGGSGTDHVEPTH